MTTQPEALRLADALEADQQGIDLGAEGMGWGPSTATRTQAAAELRRLYAEVDSLSYRLAYPDNFVKEQELLAWCNECRIELVTAIQSIASDYENAIALFQKDGESRRKAEGDVAHALKIAAKWNWNGSAIPPRREWVGLTEEEIEFIYESTESVNWGRSFARAIEAKLREKNT